MQLPFYLKRAKTNNERDRSNSMAADLAQEPGAVSTQSMIADLTQESDVVATSMIADSTQEL